MGTRLNRDLILNAHDLSTEEVHVPEWADPETGADTVLVRGMSGRERDAFEVAGRDERTGKRRPDALSNIRAKLVACCVVDDDGKRLFSDADVAALGEKSGAAIDRVFAAASRLSGMDEEDQEEAVRDFGPADGSGSPSSLPPGSAPPSTNSSAGSAAGN